MNKNDVTQAVVMALPDFDTRDYLLTSFVIGSPKVKRHVERLGRQTRCEMLSGRRYYIWEYDHWRIYVHNVGGVSFELLEGLTEAEYRAAWEDYKARMGVTPERIAAKRAELTRPDA